MDMYIYVYGYVMRILREDSWQWHLSRMFISKETESTDAFGRNKVIYRYFQVPLGYLAPYVYIVLFPKM